MNELKDEYLLELVNSNNKSEALKLIQKYYSTSLKDANDYLDSIMSKENKSISKRKNKSLFLKYTLISIPVILVTIVLVGVIKADDYNKELKNTYDNFYKESYGPKDYKEAYLEIVNNNTMTVDDKQKTYLELRENEISNIPFKETEYWKNYRIK